jgi:hypothetical protein
MPLQIKPLAIINFRYSGNPVASIRYFAKVAKVARVIDALRVGCVAECKPRQLIELLAADHHNPTATRAFFTGILSVQTPDDASLDVLADIDDRIEQATRDLSEKLGVPVVAWIHRNTKTRHAHLLFPNSNGKRTLALASKFLKELQGFEWTDALASGRGKGRRQALPVYAHAKNLAVRDLAGQVAGQGGVTADQWEKLLAAGVIATPRRRKNGELISFEYGGRRIRASTLEGFARELAHNNKQTKEKTMTKIINPAAPLPPAVAGVIEAAGYALDEFQALLDEFSNTRLGHSAAREHEQANDQNQQPPAH